VGSSCGAGGRGSTVEAKGHSGEAHKDEDVRLRFVSSLGVMPLSLGRSASLITQHFPQKFSSNHTLLSVV
jgi:hypothetical protein